MLISNIIKLFDNLIRDIILQLQFKTNQQNISARNLHELEIVKIHTMLVNIKIRFDQKWSY